MLINKTVSNIEVDCSHGEVLMVTFTDGVTLNISSVIGTDMEDLSPIDDLFVSVDGVVI